MHSVSDRTAAMAGVTLVEALMIHLEEAGLLSTDDRALVFDTAIEAHATARGFDDDTPHRDVIALLRVLRDRSDGVRFVGAISREAGNEDHGSGS